VKHGYHLIQSDSQGPETVLLVSAIPN
jgi:hypothetical protein